MEAVVIYLAVNEVVFEEAVSESSCQGLFVAEGLGSYWFLNFSLFSHLLFYFYLWYFTVFFGLNRQNSLYMMLIVLFEVRF